MGWTSHGLEYEADPRQAERLLEELELDGDGVKGVVTPGVKTLVHQVQSEQTLPERDHTRFRALAASRLGAPHFLLMRVGPFADVWEGVARGQLAKGDETAALIAAAQRAARGVREATIVLLRPRSVVSAARAAVKLSHTPRTALWPIVKPLSWPAVGAVTIQVVAKAKSKSRERSRRGEPIGRQKRGKGAAQDHTGASRSGARI